MDSELVTRLLAFTLQRVLCGCSPVWSQ